MQMHLCNIKVKLEYHINWFEVKFKWVQNNILYVIFFFYILDFYCSLLKRSWSLQGQCQECSMWRAFQGPITFVIFVLYKWCVFNWKTFLVCNDSKLSYCSPSKPSGKGLISKILWNMVTSWEQTARYDYLLILSMLIKYYISNWYQNVEGLRLFLPHQVFTSFRKGFYLK